MSDKRKEVLSSIFLQFFQSFTSVELFLLEVIMHLESRF